jgi:hypothetical protein
MYAEVVMIEAQISDMASLIVTNSPLLLSDSRQVGHYHFGINIALSMAQGIGTGLGTRNVDKKFL